MTPSKRGLILARRGQDLVDDLVGRLVQPRLGEAHRGRQPPHQIPVRDRLAERLDRLVVVLQVQVPVGHVQIDPLELRHRGQHDVGVLRGIGHELLMDDCEEIVAQQSFDGLDRVGRGRDRVAAEDEERHDRRVVDLARVRFAPSWIMLISRGSAGIDRDRVVTALPSNWIWLEVDVKQPPPRMPI